MYMIIFTVTKITVKTSLIQQENKSKQMFLCQMPGNGVVPMNEVIYTFATIIENGPYGMYPFSSDCHLGWVYPHIHGFPWRP